MRWLVVVGFLILGACSGKTTAELQPELGEGTCAGIGATITGTNGDDVLHGTASLDVIQGSGGDDRIFGEEAGDILCGGEGVDRVEGNRGGDEIHGSPGADNLFGGLHDDFLDGGPGVNDFGDGGDGSDVCVDVELTISCQ